MSMPTFIIDACIKKISLLKLKLAKADGYVARKQLEAQIKDEQKQLDLYLMSPTDIKQTMTNRE